MIRPRGFLKAWKSQRVPCNNFMESTWYNYCSWAPCIYIPVHNPTSSNGVLLLDYEGAWDKVQVNHGHQWCVVEPSTANQVLSQELYYYMELRGKLLFLWLAVQEWPESCLDDNLPSKRNRGQLWRNKKNRFKEKERKNDETQVLDSRPSSSQLLHVHFFFHIWCVNKKICKIWAINFAKT